MKPPMTGTPESPHLADATSPRVICPLLFSSSFSALFVFSSPFSCVALLGRLSYQKSLLHLSQESGSFRDTSPVDHSPLRSPGYASNPPSRHPPEFSNKALTADFDRRVGQGLGPID
ncbi:hypothetical protein Cob_v004996 [Colletotrichum orbiculare MAFF 240422]|uniref:Uncharacterized protein n=1 Tax=Colletotrichum orbiculare (strain 104-T / ATCC 96160 / CBS 514.97 / LARS 414 / MAFF 240422) TaxID=1213857 RepID=A0A484FUY4_COLOR|nr:hypothetical protein Cob_v004996 [Colletotrichum orbiculare MAFF 240422]